MDAITRALLIASSKLLDEVADDSLIDSMTGARMMDRSRRARILCDKLNIALKPPKRRKREKWTKQR